MKAKRWISVLLCVGMLLSFGILPTTVFAADEADTGDGTEDISWYAGSEAEGNTGSSAAAGNEQPAGDNTASADGEEQPAEGNAASDAADGEEQPAEGNVASASADGEEQPAEGNMASDAADGEEEPAEADPDEEADPAGDGEPSLPETVQKMIDALPEASEITLENLEEAAEQISAIEEAREQLSEEEWEQLDTARFDAVCEALSQFMDAPMILAEGDGAAVGIVWWGYKVDGKDKELIIGASEADVRAAGATEDNKNKIQDYNTATASKPWSSTSSSPVRSVKIVSKIYPTTTKDWFKSFTALETIEGIENLDTSNVTDMTSMFQSCSKLTSLDVSNFNTSNVTTMNSMFNSCSKLESLNLSNFNTSKVTDMTSMFENCSALIELDLSNFDTSSVTTMKNMFSNCRGLTKLNVSSFDTSSVTNMEAMFGVSKTALGINQFGCSSLTTLDLSSFDTSKVETMEHMFYGCKSLTTLNLSSFDTSKVEIMQNMFLDCESFTSLNVSNFDTGSVKTMMQMFKNCISLKELDLSSFNTSSVTDMSHMFYNCNKLESLKLLGEFNTSNVTNMTHMFFSCERLTTLDLSNFDTRNVGGLKGSMISMFQDCRSLTELDFSKFENFDTSNVTNMNNMFSGCSGLTTLNVSTFNTKKVTSMNGMFSGCSSLKKLEGFLEETSEFDPSTAIGAASENNKHHIQDMLKGCTGLEYVDLSKFYISKYYAWLDFDDIISTDTGLRTIVMPKKSRDYDLPKPFYLPKGNTYWIKEDRYDVTGNAPYGDLFGKTLLWHNYCYGEWQFKEENGVLMHRKDCEVCEKILTDWEPHDWPWKKVNDSTHKRICTKCGVEQTGDHAWQEGNGWTIDKDPVTQDSYTHSRTCTICQGQVIEAHDWTEWTYVGDVTELQHKVSRSCKTCYHVETEDHKWGGWEDANDGTHKRTCTQEGCTAVQSKAHIWGDWTDAGNGKHKHTCVLCGHEESTAHNWGSWTDTKNGTHRRTCNDCPAEESTDHDWGRWTVAGDGKTHIRNCTQDGCTAVEQIGDHIWPAWEKVDADTHQRTCVLCEKVETGDHTWNYDTEDGVNQHICTTCGYESSSHVWGDYKDANDGKTHIRTCKATGCSVTPQSANHNLWSSWADAGDGTHSRSCGTCGAVVSAAHSWSAWGTDSTTHQRTCSTCKAVESGDHVLTENWSTDQKEHWKECSVCKAKLNKAVHTLPEDWMTNGEEHWKVCTECEAELNKAKHTLSDWKRDDEARWIKCSVCGLVEKIPHKFGELIVDKEPTCTEPGSGHRVCSGCDYEKKEAIEPRHTPKDEWEYDDHARWLLCAVCGTELDRIPHTFGELEVDEEPTCTEPGHGHRVCSGCGYIEHEAIEVIPHTPKDEWEYDDHARWLLCAVCGTELDRIPHKFGELEVDEEPTCTELGHGHRVCSGCGYKEYEDIKVTGHDISEDWESNGNEHWKKCTMCGAEFEKAGHTFGELIVDRAPTGTAAGTGHRDCTVCLYAKTEGITGKPQTGDNGNTVLWIAVMLAAGTALTGAVLYGRKKKYGR